MLWLLVDFFLVDNGGEVPDADPVAAGDAVPARLDAPERRVDSPAGGEEAAGFVVSEALAPVPAAECLLVCGI